MKKLAIVFWMVGVGVFAETQKVGPNPNIIAPFDGEFFNAKSENAEGKKTPDGRYVGEAANYNTDNRNQWLETCAPLKDKNPQGYRDCYAMEKKKTITGVQKQQEEVEAKQGQIESKIPMLDETKSLPGEDDQ